MRGDWAVDSDIWAVVRRIGRWIPIYERSCAGFVLLEAMFGRSRVAWRLIG